MNFLVFMCSFFLHSFGMFIMSSNLKMIYAVVNTHKLLIVEQNEALKMFRNTLQRETWDKRAGSQCTHLQMQQKQASLKSPFFVFFIFFFYQTLLPKLNKSPPEDCNTSTGKCTKIRKRIREWRRKLRIRFSQLLLGSVSSDSCFWLHSQFFPLDVRKHGCLEPRRVYAKDMEC